MNVTVAICTWNRCRLLQQTLDQMAHLRIPDDVRWELVLVDNGSTDATPTVIDSFRDRLPIVKIDEPRQGHSIARNRAIDHASGDYILWTDNDVLVAPDWLARYAAGFHQYPEAVYFGSKIVPVFQAGKPDWLEATWDLCKPVYAARDLGDKPMPLGNGTYPYGANFAVRTDVQRRFRFDESHGRRGRRMVGDDEIDVMRRMDEAGYQGQWLPNAGVEHVVPADRTSPTYIGRYFVGQGLINIRRQKVDKSLWVALKESIVNQLAWRVKRFFSKPDEWVSHLIRAHLSLGEFRGLREQRRRSP